MCLCILECNEMWFILIGKVWPDTLQCNWIARLDDDKQKPWWPNLFCGGLQDISPLTISCTFNFCPSQNFTTTPKSVLLLLSLWGLGKKAERRKRVCLGPCGRSGSSVIWFCAGTSPSWLGDTWQVLVRQQPGDSSVGLRWGSMDQDSGTLAGASRPFTFSVASGFQGWRRPHGDVGK